MSVMDFIPDMKTNCARGDTTGRSGAEVATSGQRPSLMLCQQGLQGLVQQLSGLREPR
jgi:hypothetical protein